MSSRNVSLTDDQAPEVFDVANWLDRATATHPKVTTDYVPRHRADGPAA